MEGFENKNTGLVLAATNFPEMLDPAVVRRFEKRLFVDLPTTQARGNLINKLFAKNKHNLLEEDFERLAKEMEGYSGSDIAVVVREALWDTVAPLTNAEYFKVSVFQFNININLK